MNPERAVKKKAWSEWESEAGEFRSGSVPGFSPRHLWRFFLVDLIVVMSLRLLYSRSLIPNLDAYVALTLAGKVVLAGYLVWMIRDASDGWRAVGFKTGGRPFGWIWAAVIYAAAYPVMYFAGLLNYRLMNDAYHFFGWGRFEPALQDVTLILLGGDARFEVKVALLAFAAVLGPILEEIAFRGVGMDGFRRNGGAWGAAVGTSLLFGLYHFDLARVLPLAVMGFAMAGARHVSRTLWCPMAIHVFHNSFALWLIAAKEGGFRW